MWMVRSKGGFSLFCIFFTRLLCFAVRFLEGKEKGKGRGRGGL